MLASRSSDGTASASVGRDPGPYHAAAGDVSIPVRQDHRSGGLPRSLTGSFDVQPVERSLQGPGIGRAGVGGAADRVDAGALGRQRLGAQ